MVSVTLRVGGYHDSFRMPLENLNEEHPCFKENTIYISELHADPKEFPINTCQNTTLSELENKLKNNNIYEPKIKNLTDLFHTKPRKIYLCTSNEQIDFDNNVNNRDIDLLNKTRSLIELIKLEFAAEESINITIYCGSKHAKYINEEIPEVEYYDLRHLQAKINPYYGRSRNYQLIRR